MKRWLPYIVALGLILSGLLFFFSFRTFQVVGVVFFGLAALTLLLTWFARMKNRRLAKWLRGGLCFLVAAGLVLFGLTAVQVITAGGGDAADADYLIVLGAGVNGTQPSRCLRERLEATEAYLLAHPDAVAVLSGGQGAGEELSEAECMYRWLTNRGIAPERLILEDRATTTEENLLFSTALLEDREMSALAVVSNDFHLYRAKLLAKQQGLEVQTVSAPSGDRLYYCYMIFRETLGVWYSYLFG